ncbi:MAG: hypothetical protein LAO08_00410 [Acidobacteriia bacterium]|nr:hypothetical protein [Terriglobia bacterium]
MSATTPITPVSDAALHHPNDAGQLHAIENSQIASPVSPDPELQKLNEQELKSAILFAWKKHQRLAQKDMGPLLFWLRIRLRAQGSRNDLHDKDRGFGAWVEKNLDMGRSTAARWADKYRDDNGLREQDLITSTHVGRSCKNTAFYNRKLAKRGKGIKVWVKEPLREKYEHALNAVKKHFNIANNAEAVVKGLCYAADNLTEQTPAVRRRKG